MAFQDFQEQPELQRFKLPEKITTFVYSGEPHTLVRLVFGGFAEFSKAKAPATVEKPS
jgi:hypothetical protein